MERENLTQSLDAEFADIYGLLAASKRAKQDEDKKQDDDFEKVVRELAFEMRAHPTDRLKSPEEIARAEKQRLEELEVWIKGTMNHLLTHRNNECRE